MIRRRLFVVIFLIGGSAVQLPMVARGQFTDVSEASGISVGATSELSPFATAGQAACAVDLNGDGWTDIILSRPELPCEVMINQRDGTFVDEAAVRGLAGVSHIAGVAAGDFTNTGKIDIVMVPLLGNRYFYFENDGSGNFTEVAVARGADSTISSRHRGQSVSLVDYDLDGYLDIHVSEYNVRTNPDDHLHSVLLRNRGAAMSGHFENATREAGLVQPVSGNFHYVFASAWADFDQDSFPDVASVQDFRTTQLYWNNGTGSFSNGTAGSGLLGSDDMGVAVADYDGDGWLDVFFGSVRSERRPVLAGNRLYKNLRNRQFLDLAEPARVKDSGWSWGAAFFEANNDGKPDIIVTNGLLNDPEFGADASKLFINQGAIFSDQSAQYSINDSRLGRAVLVLDFNNDGREDVLITHAIGPRVLYRNDTPQGDRRWLRLQFQGTISNRDGFGVVAKATVGGQTFTSLYQPTNAYLAQREPYLHIGLGAASVVDRLEIRWPSGVVQTLSNVEVNRVHQIIEPTLPRVAPILERSPEATTVKKGRTLRLTAAASGTPSPVYRWFQDGKLVADQTGPRLEISNAHAVHAGNYTVKALSPLGSVESAAVPVRVTLDTKRQTVARWWNEALLDAIRKDVPNPPVHARNLYTLSAAMWDVYWAYEPGAWNRVAPAFHREILPPSAWGTSRVAAQRKAMSYAAFRILQARFKLSVGKVRTEIGNRWLMTELGYDPNFIGTVGDDPAAVGNRIGDAVLAAMLNDGANEANNYADATGYASVNSPLLTSLPGAIMHNINRWQPLDLAFSVTQNGIVLPPAPQKFVGVNGFQTRPFAFVRPGPRSLPPMLDIGPPPILGGVGDERFRDEVVQVIEFSSWLDPSDGVMINISPGAMMNHPLGTNAGMGHARNPVTGGTYADQFVPRADFCRVLAEYWADGPSSETPPGHWNVIFNQINDHPLTSRRWLGVGRPLTRLEWEIRGYFALNGAVHDAACAAWSLKRIYDGPRPICLVRTMATLGQSSLPSHPTYHVDGLPLVPGLIELITTASSAPGGRHAHLAEFSEREIAIRAWRGNPDDPRNQIGGVAWIRAKEWLPYQLETFVSPAFPGYISGHSTFSSAAAEVLTRMTGSAFFPGGLGQKQFPQNGFLTFEKGPSQPVTLQWATYYDAADQAGLSRLYGGIHVAVDDFEGRKIGRLLGEMASSKVEAMRSTSISGIDHWREIFYNTSENAGPAANTAAPHGDGVANIIKYALGAAADERSLAYLPQAGRDDEGNLQFQFHRFSNKSDISYHVDMSGDLTDWREVATSHAGEAMQEITDLTEKIEEQVLLGGRVRVSVTVPAPILPQQQRFLRLRITQP